MSGGGQASGSYVRVGASRGTIASRVSHEIDSSCAREPRVAKYLSTRRGSGDRSGAAIGGPRASSHRPAAAQVLATPSRYHRALRAAVLLSGRAHLQPAEPRKQATAI